MMILLCVLRMSVCVGAQHCCKSCHFGVEGKQNEAKGEKESLTILGWSGAVTTVNAVI